MNLPCEIDQCSSLPYSRDQYLSEEESFENSSSHVFSPPAPPQFSKDAFAFRVLKSLPASYKGAELYYTDCCRAICNFPGCHSCLKLWPILRVHFFYLASTKQSDLGVRNQIVESYLQPPTGYLTLTYTIDEKEANFFPPKPPNQNIEPPHYDKVMARLFSLWIITFHKRLP